MFNGVNRNTLCIQVWEHYLWFLNGKMCEVKQYKRMLLEFLVWFLGQPFLSNIRSAYAVSIAEDRSPGYILGWGVWAIIEGKYNLKQYWDYDYLFL